jgi:tRNA(His) 5'-end guanylyltransferase
MNRFDWSDVNVQTRERVTENRAFFDARVFPVDGVAEAAKAVYWRQRDCFRNAISTYGRSYYSHRELHGVRTDQLILALASDKKFDVLADAPKHFLYGAFAKREQYHKEALDQKTGLMVSCIRTRVRVDTLDWRGWTEDARNKFARERLWPEATSPQWV